MTHRPTASIVLAMGLLVAAGTWAQAPAPAAKASAKTPTKTSRPAKAAPVVPVAPPLAKVEAGQLAAAALTHFGDYACEFEQAVTVNVTPMSDGYVDVKYKSQTWTMKPVLSSTGALRLEDVKGRMLMLQIANKSMLMDAKLGQRVVDGCVHEKQRLATAAAASQPAAAGLLDSGAASAPK